MLIWRSRADSNRCTRFCRPLPSHSATRPFVFRNANVGNSSLIAKPLHVFTLPSAKIGQISCMIPKIKKPPIMGAFGGRGWIRTTVKSLADPRLALGHPTLIAEFSKLDSRYNLIFGVPLSLSIHNLTQFWRLRYTKVRISMKFERSGMDSNHRVESCGPSPCTRPPDHKNYRLCDWRNQFPNFPGTCNLKTGGERINWAINIVLRLEVGDGFEPPCRILRTLALHSATRP